MTLISNKTREPLSVALPRGKKLHLGPGKTGQIAPTAVDHPAVKQLVEAGKIEILGEEPRQTEHDAGGKKARPWTRAHASGGAIRSSGDR